MPSGPFPASSVPAGNPLEPAPPATAELQPCPECGGKVVERPLALRCSDCGLLMRKPGIDYGNVMDDD